MDHVLTDLRAQHIICDFILQCSLLANNQIIYRKKKMEKGKSEKKKTIKLDTKHVNS